MQYRSFMIKQNEGNNIYYFLKNKGFSENYITNLRKTCDSIILNGLKANTRTKIKEGDELKISTSPNPKTTIKPCRIPLDIVFEDEYYLLIYKPSGLSCMPNRSHYDNNLAGGIIHYLSDKEPNFTLRIINRLDKDTAGFILIAKSSTALQEIKEIDKSYLAICEGQILSNIVIDKKIETININGVNDKKRIISDNGKDAKTYVKPLSCNNNATLISVKLEHGRTHQIRLHLSSIGHPLVGDEIYGTQSNLINHTALICDKFTFFHPYKNQKMVFTHPLPQDFINALNKLGLKQPLQLSNL